METIKLSNGVEVSKDEYIKAKTLDLIEFGYNDLSEDTVKDELNYCLENNNYNTIIGAFIMKDLKKTIIP